MEFDFSEVVANQHGHVIVGSTILLYWIVHQNNWDAVIYVKNFTTNEFLIIEHQLPIDFIEKVDSFMGNSYINYYNDI